MGVLEVAVLAMVGRMVALGAALGARMVPRILEFADWLDLVICGTSFARRGAE